MVMSAHLSSFLRPLCPETEHLLRGDDGLREQDRLRISLVWRTYERKGVTYDVRKFYMVATRGSSSYAVNRWFERIPAHEKKTNIQTMEFGCEAPVTDTTVLITMAVWGRDRIMFDDEMAKLEFYTKLTSFTRQTSIAELQAKYKHEEHVPDDAPTGHPDRLPMPHQRVAAKALLDSPEGYALFMEMRTGKTYSFIMAMDKDSEEFPNAMNIVVCPKNVRSNWMHEINVSTTKKVNVVVLRGGKLNRIKLVLDAFECRDEYDYTVVVTSYEGLCRTISMLSAMKWRWGNLDESHYIKGSYTERNKAVLKLRDSVQKRVGMTGTPICNGMWDLHTQLEWLGEGCSGFASKKEFKDYYGRWLSTGRREILLGMQNLPLLQERLVRHSFILSKKEALKNLPPVTNQIIEVEMTDYQADIYEKISSQLFAEIESDLEAVESGQKKTITITNILTKLLRLSQITSGFIPLDGVVDIDTGEVVSREIDRIDPNPKLEELIEYLKNRDPGSKSLVWCWWTQDVKTIAARLELEGIKYLTFYGPNSDVERDQAEWLFNNDPEYTVLVGRPDVGGLGKKFNGLCLDTDGNRIAQCDSICYYSQGWSHPIRKQSEARPQDKDCTWSIDIVDFCVPCTIDTQILDRVLSKAEHAMTIQDVRKLLKGVVLQ